MKTEKSDRYYRFKVNLKGAKRIWRTIVLRGDETLDDLHEAIFLAFDRDDEHLYSFYFPKAPGRGQRPARPPKEFTVTQIFGDPVPFRGEDQLNAATARLDDLRLKPGQRFEYLFDFGDSWLHELSVEAVGPIEAGTQFGIIERRGASPPQYEDFDD